ncbi:SH3 domain-containing protein (plasmid) [Deinococcus sp. KNUC1210]|uniref:SH3 domain-containing protein n=1 Tax=Deinococcus sp. KNUC1210 TaxID=2917691 RepID=UPI001EEF968A|nr:SH3 domain-containing protein [Deinococcus sp. KNUC1210]ULH17887.1 SH3 domain-containing protein [Deinococcus sp. KNUC1210]
MKRFLVLSICAALTLTPSPSAFATQRSDQQVAVMIEGDSLRSRPNPNASVLKKLPKGTTVTVSSCFPEWCAVKYQNVPGFVLKDMLVVAENPATSVSLRILRLLNVTESHCQDLLKATLVDRLQRELDTPLHCARLPLPANVVRQRIDQAFAIDPTAPWKDSPEALSRFFSFEDMPPAGMILFKQQQVVVAFQSTERL